MRYSWQCLVGTRPLSSYLSTGADLPAVSSQALAQWFLSLSVGPRGIEGLPRIVMASTLSNDDMNADGERALHVAVDRDYDGLVRLLLEHG